MVAPWMESDVDVTSLGIFLEKGACWLLPFYRRTTSSFAQNARFLFSTRRFVWTWVTTSKKWKKRWKIFSEYLEAEKERLPKSHEANCFSLLSLVSPLSVSLHTYFFVSSWRPTNSSLYSAHNGYFFRRQGMLTTRLYTFYASLRFASVVFSRAFPSRFIFLRR